MTLAIKLKIIYYLINQTIKLPSKITQNCGTFLMNISLFYSVIDSFPCHCYVIILLIIVEPICQMMNYKNTGAQILNCSFNHRFARAGVPAFLLKYLT